MKRTTAEPGIYPGMTFEDYLALDAVNHSALEWMVTRTPEHFHWHQTAEPEPSTPDQELGRIIHMAILEPTAFKERVQIGPINPSSGKCYGRGSQIWKSEQKAAELDGTVLVREGEYVMLQALRAKAMEHGPLCHALGLEGINECVAVWRDPETGVVCKGRADRFVPGVILIDLKSTRSAAPRPFGHDAAKFGYHRQAEHYAKGFPLAAATSGLDATPVPAALVAFEKEPPYGIAVYTFPEAELAIAAQENAEALARVAACRRADRWPGYPKTVEPLTLPAWAVPHLEALA